MNTEKSLSWEVEQYSLARSRYFEAVPFKVFVCETGFATVFSFILLKIISIPIVTIVVIVEATVHFCSPKVFRLIHRKQNERQPGVWQTELDNFVISPEDRMNIYHLVGAVCRADTEQFEKYAKLVGCKYSLTRLSMVDDILSHGNRIIRFLKRIEGYEKRNQNYYAQSG